MRYPAHTHPRFIFVIFVASLRTTLASAVSKPSLHLRRNAPENCLVSCAVTTYNMSGELPNVLVVGDSIASAEHGYFKMVQHLLHDEVKLHQGMYRKTGHLPQKDVAENGMCGTSHGALVCTDALLGAGGWDMIIFNWGLHDICPEKYAAISKSDYVDNIGKMYQKMAKMLKDDGRVIWQTTTPISPFNEGRTNHDVLSLNAAASRLWSETAHPPYINDLHAAMLGACRAFQPAGDDGTVPIPCYPNDCECPLQQPGNVHFNFQGNWVLAASVADAIRSVLKHDAAPVGKSK